MWYDVSNHPEKSNTRVYGNTPLSQLRGLSGLRLKSNASRKMSEIALADTISKEINRVRGHIEEYLVKSSQEEIDSKIEKQGKEEARRQKELREEEERKKRLQTNQAIRYIQNRKTTLRS